ncbi:hypothetical protein Aperf_G00000057985 [Anoplocephala perfoliata]
MNIPKKNIRFAKRFQTRFISLTIIVVCLLLVWYYLTHKTRPSGTEPENVHLNLDIGYYEESVANAYFTSIDSANHQNCHQFRMQYPYKKGPDGDMALAFTITVHSDIRQFSRILRMIYRENNYYCVHVDLNANPVFEAAVRGAAKCFGSNVELVPSESRAAIINGQNGGLKAQLVCAEQALKRNSNWRYLLSISQEQLPLKTNLELIAALKALNGSNLMEAYPIDRFKAMVGDHKLPLNATWYKGTAHAAYRREFIQEAVLGLTAAPIRSMLLEPNVFPNAEELFFTLLAYNSQFRMPGACLIAPSPPQETNLGYLGNFIIWGDYKISCPTKYDHFVCVLGNAHLNTLKVAPHLFAGKFLPDFEPEAFFEIEQWYFEKIKAEIGGASNPIAPSIYGSLSCSKLHL